MITEKLLEVARCPRCITTAGKDRDKGRLEVVEGGFVCKTCDLAYGAFSNSGKEEPVVSEGKKLPRRGYIDLLPRQEVGQQTRYLEDEFEHELDHEHISLPLPPKDWLEGNMNLLPDALQLPAADVPHLLDDSNNVSFQHHPTALPTST